MKIINKKGFTIVEVLIAVAITTLLLGGLIGMMLSFKTRYEENQTILLMENELKNIIDIISRDVKVADSVVTSFSGYGSSSDTIVLKMNSIDSSNNILDYGVNYDYVVYRPNPSDNDEIQRITIADTLSSRVSGTETLNDNSEITISFSFNEVTYENVSVVEINLQGEASAVGDDKTGSLSTKVSLRSKI